jgi:uracil-DNA glycosylase family 4
VQRETSGSPLDLDDLNTRIIACGRCPRLRQHCRAIAKEKRKSFRDWDYWGKPVPNFGDPRARVLVVGLAPAAHGANRTGRMFTGDRSGEWLYRALHKAGLANQAESTSRDDGLHLHDCMITAVAHCAPPENKPEKHELLACEPFLSRTFDSLPLLVIIALGSIAWSASLAEVKRKGWYTQKGAAPRFAHGARVELEGGRILLGSYHPSQQNTFTGKLTEPMFDSIFAGAVHSLRVTR